MYLVIYPQNTEQLSWIHYKVVLRMGGKPENPEKNLGQERVPKTNSTLSWRRVENSNLSHTAENWTGELRALSQLPHPCPY